jgi:flagellin
MSSINTNLAAITALQTLNQTNKNMLTTQNRISTGYRVATAEDNAAYWSIATTMRSDNKALSTVQDALGLGAAKVDVAYTGLNSAIDVVDEIKAKLVAAREPGVDRSKIQSELSALQNQLQSIADGASFSGENWLSVDTSDPGYSATKSIVSSFTRAADGTVSVGTVDIDVTSTTLYDDGDAGILDADGANYTTASIATLDITSADNADIDNMILDADAALSAMTTAASDLGAAKKRINLQKDFVANLMDAIDRGVGQLVDADMNEESTRLQALQVQQQLGVQALSIANSSSQSILQLFRG